MKERVVPINQHHIELLQSSKMYMSHIDEHWESDWMIWECEHLMVWECEQSGNVNGLGMWISNGVESEHPMVWKCEYLVSWNQTLQQLIVTTQGLRVIWECARLPDHNRNNKGYIYWRTEDKTCKELVKSFPCQQVCIY